MSLARDIVDRLFFPNRDVHAIPVLDGGFSPNERLDQARIIGGPAFEAPDGLTVDDRGTLFVSSNHTVFACTGAERVTRKAFVNFDAAAGALAWSERSGLLVCVSAHGLCAVDDQGHVTSWLEAVNDVPIRCPTAVTVADDGTVFVLDGSVHNPPDRWLHDLMQKHQPSGRLIACDSALANAHVLASNLDWPCGIAVAHDRENLLVSESWSHRLTAFDRSGADQRLLVENFAGYPGSIVRGARRDYWMVFFALRTQLTDFVLREDGFRARMMANVPSHLWVGPTLGGTFDYREPTQIGRIKKLGIQKPWAPPRSYGLVARLDAQGRALESFHSRASGRFHGVTSVVLDGERVLVSSRGHGGVAELPIGTADGKRK